MGPKPSSSAKERGTGPLDYDDGPIIWIDCEMTGLDPNKDRLLEIALIITNGDLSPIDPQGISFIIKTDKEVLDNMNEWCIKHHGESGLTAACLASKHTFDYVSRSVLRYVKDRIPRERVAVLAGNSVHMDRAFLTKYMPGLINHLHYRIIDVSTIKELCRRWYPEVTEAKRTQPMEKENKHRALDDILGSIEELRFYRQHIFKDPSDIVSSNI
ncbi:ribonuclease H-like protein [Cantharellus anzutake]|uniref:ribonuclease H-like protein n=1 Tax=Cantharellus anzutake TaxID=1750568 RepID=UPI00190541BE|nr:ribonuclease H-like protein [Cantharellus anzutake]KAF8342716.1 ribonuclease H-like protein [Cantharellus anzutake]